MASNSNSSYWSSLCSKSHRFHIVGWGCHRHSHRFCPVGYSNGLHRYRWCGIVAVGYNGCRG